MKELYREKLEPLFEKSLDFPVVFISAPVGWGKSRAVYAFLEKKDITTLWISADENSRDDIVARIWQGIEPFFPEKPQQPGDVSCLKDAVRSMELPGRFAVVIDDCPAPLPKWAMDVLEVFQKARVPGLNIYLISRNDFNLSNSFSAVSRRMTISAKDLTFTPEEIRELFELNGLPGADKLAAELRQWVGGWVMGAHLAVSEYESGRNPTGFLPAWQVVKREVVDKIDENAADQLSQLSLLSEFDYNTATEITLSPEITDILARMESENLFISYDASSAKYSFHPVLRRVLADRIFENRQLYKKTCERCGLWFMGRNDILAAWRFYYYIDRHDRMMELLNDDRNSVILRNIPDLVFESLEKMKPLYKLGYAESLFKALYYYICTEHRGDGYRVADKTFPLVEYERSPERKQKLNAELEFITAMRYWPDLYKMNEAAAAFMPHAPSEVLDQQLGAFCASPHFLTAYHNIPGGLWRLMDFIRSDRWVMSAAVGGDAETDLQMQAEYALETGDYSEAEKLADMAVYKSELRGRNDSMLYGYYVKIRNAILRGDKAEVMSIRELIEEAGIAGSDPQTSFQNRCIVSITDHAIGNAPEDTGAPDFSCRSPAEISECAIRAVAAGRRFIFVGDHSKLLALGLSMYELGSARHMVFLQIYGLLYASCACKGTGDDRSAASHLAKALDLCAPDGVVTPPVELAPWLPVPDFSGLQPDYAQKLRRIRTAFLKVHNRHYFRPSASALSKRECEIMELYCKGYNQSEIAAKLYISVETARQHIKNIYVKLGVNRKPAAIEAWEMMLGNSRSGSV